MFEASKKPIATNVAKWLSPLVYGTILSVLIFIDSKVIIGLLNEMLDIRVFIRFSGELGEVLNIKSSLVRFLILEASLGTTLLLVFNIFIVKFEKLKGHEIALKDHVRQSLVYYSVLIFITSYSFLGFLQGLSSWELSYYAGVYYLPLVTASLWAIVVNAVFLWCRKKFFSQENLVS